MGVSARSCTVEIDYNSYTNSLIFPESDLALLFPQSDLETEPNYHTNKKLRCVKILKTIDSRFLSLFHLKEMHYAYDYVIENLLEGQKERRLLLSNNDHLCAAIYFFMARKRGYTIKKSQLIKFFDLESSDFNVDFLILEKTEYFKDLIKSAGKEEKLLWEVVEFIPISGVPIKLKKPPNESGKTSTLNKNTFFPFFPFFLFYDFDKNFILKNTIMNFQISNHCYLNKLHPNIKNVFIIGMLAQYQHNLFVLFSLQINLLFIKIIILKNLGECDFKYKCLVDAVNSFIAKIEKNYKKCENIVKN